MAWELVSLAFYFDEQTLNIHIMVFSFADFLEIRLKFAWSTCCTKVANWNTVLSLCPSHTHSFTHSLSSLTFLSLCYLKSATREKDFFFFFYLLSVTRNIWHWKVEETHTCCLSPGLLGSTTICHWQYPSRGKCPTQNKMVSYTAGNSSILIIATKKKPGTQKCLQQLHWYWVNIKSCRVSPIIQFYA